MPASRLSTREKKGSSGKGSNGSASSSKTGISSSDEENVEEITQKTKSGKEKMRGLAASTEARLAEAANRAAAIVAKALTEERQYEVRRMGHELAMSKQETDKLKLDADKLKYAASVTVSKNTLAGKELDSQILSLKAEESEAADNRKRSRYSEEADNAIRTLTARSEASIETFQQKQWSKDTSANKKAALMSSRKSQVIGNMQASSALMGNHLHGPPPGWGGNMSGGGYHGGSMGGGGYPGCNYGSSSYMGGGGYPGGNYGGGHMGGGGFPGGNHGDGPHGGGGFQQGGGGGRGGGGRGGGGGGYGFQPGGMYPGGSYGGGPQVGRPEYGGAGRNQQRDDWSGPSADPPQDDERAKWNGGECESPPDVEEID
jgi:hypothetical protein